VVATQLGPRRRCPRIVEMLNLMRRAVELREGLQEAAESVTDLLWRLWETAESRRCRFR
jgi:hypothetical protein